MTDSLHTRYMAASATWRTHRKGCPPCQHQRRCPDGDLLYERLVKVQDAYLAHLRAR
ncbi:hypothetical protein [Streptomyces sp. NPDC024089]|uniref:hypothetical protein n=1 Tax=Streptomyces sp. NPDC024089 TaxID=3154328 RepID=UPI0033FF1953